MSTTRVLATALPYSLADDAEKHLSVFVTHRLVPESADATLADFPATAAWVDTLAASTLELLTSSGAELPLEVVSAPDAAAWAASFPPSTPVAGFPEPALAQATWNSYPAHRTADAAADLHLVSALLAPTARPGVQSSPVAQAVLAPMREFRRDVRALDELARRNATRAERLLARRLRDAQVSLGQQQRRGDDRPIEDVTSAIEVFLDDAEGDARFTEYLDHLLGEDLSANPVLRMLVDAHAARRFYQRPEAEVGNAYQRTPTDGATTPRPETPEHDFHARAAALGSTPSLLRRLGLVLDVRLAADDVAALAGVTWVAARLTTAPDADVVRLAPPRVDVVVRPPLFRAASSDAWVGGALPLGDAEYVVLDLDPDASGLKVEQHLRDTPNELASEVNGDAASSAPGTLRSTGFAVARTDRVAATRERVAAAEALDAVDDAPGVVGPSLRYDDVVRGLRLEVWDDASGQWHSLHHRLVDVTATGDDQVAVAVLTEEPDTGFLQLSGLNRVPGDDANPYYLHEVIAGWDGWSLSTPRPGKVIVHGPDGEEQLHEEPPDPAASNVHITTHVAPGTLPRLRYGTSYAFRLVGVDLAGNSVPRRPAPAGPPAPEAVELAEAHLAGLRRTYAARDDASLASALRDGVLEALPAVDRAWGDLEELARSDADPDDAVEFLAERSRERSGRADGAAEGTRRARSRAARRMVPAELLTGDAEIDDAVAARLAEATTADDDAGEGASPFLTDRVADLHARVAAASRVIAEGSPTWRVRPQLGTDARRIADLDDLVPLPGLPLRPVVTTPRPYLRWDAVPPPALVARAPLTTGEQLSRLVVRTGLPDTSPDAAATSERHVVPAKAHQVEAETFGHFDTAIGSTDAAAQRTAYGVALAERGTLTDQWIPDLDNPGQVVEQQGIALHSRPDADPDTAVTLAQITADRETQLGEGQYVVHDVDDLVLPYLPDPFAAGIALLFYDAGAPHLLPDARVLQAVVIPFGGEWPRLEPIRLVLEGADELGARLEGRVLHVGLPAGEQVRLALSSSLRPADLRKLGMWRTHPADAVAPDAPPALVQAALVLRHAALSGWTWWLTPAVDVRLVHAVPQPARVPRLVALRALARPPGLTVAPLVGLADVHGPSTDRLQVRARWSEWVDDLATDGPAQVERTDVVVDSPVADAEGLGLLWMFDFTPFGTAPAMVALREAGVVGHRAIQTFADTHHRRVEYTPSGTTRYREFFAAADVPPDDDPALAGDSVTLTIPSSARPAAPDLVDTVPLLRWESVTEPDQPFALRRTRRGGVRLWLARPWFSSGDGELLAVLLGPTLPDSSTSVWGRDPVMVGAPVTGATAPPLVELGHLLVQGLSGGLVERSARPVLPGRAVPVVDLEGSPAALVLAYRPEYHAGRRQWFVDVALDQTPALWPFVRLAVARYQPDSIDGCALSQVALTSWVQPLPERVATISRPDARRVRVTLTGVVALLRSRRRDDVEPAPDLPDGAPFPPDLPGGPGTPGEIEAPEGTPAEVDALLARSRVVVASLQMLPDGAGDLEWETVARRRLPVVGSDESARVTWTGELVLQPGEDRPALPPLRTPGTSERWRVLVEEHELLDADPVDAPNASGRTTITPRLVYADTIAL